MKFDCNYNVSWESGLPCLCEMGRYIRSFGCISLATYLEDVFLFFNENIYVMDTQKNRLNETVLSSIQTRFATG